MSEDGKIILVASDYGYSALCLNNEGEVLWSFNPKKYVYHVEISPGDEFIVAATTSCETKQDKCEYNVYILDRMGKKLFMFQK